MPARRQLPYRPGDTVRVHSVFGGYSLPPGVPENAEVIVGERDIGWLDVIYQGQRFHIFMCCIDSGWEYFVNERWVRQKPTRSECP